MESAPAAFAGGVCALFGAALLLWTTRRVRQGRPVAVGTTTVTRTRAAAVAAGWGLTLSAAGLWLLSGL
ncbi:hypothetical protein JJV70_17055 [Streptomyces sp. JJ66]|uniref:hypothetical protein n=1 Tax=Streptomyces sp. JJ66 TaxID=2803843 RepID=UPI001C58A4FE|nr:hypothetical protein [Streptomyces sp. JJ66]MBW1603786.1 hypothetical protein [Streptomyces sp. JJ66]